MSTEAQKAAAAHAREELEANLQTLRVLGLPDMGPEELEVTMLYEEIRSGKSVKTFVNAEKTHGLGYNGLSKHKKQIA